MPTDEAGREALGLLDAALAAAPEKDGPDLSAALRCLGRFRDGFVAANRDEPVPARQEALAQINGVISCVMAAQYPLGEVPWPSVRKARDRLAELVAAAQGPEASP